LPFLARATPLFTIALELPSLSRCLNHYARWTHAPRGCACKRVRRAELPRPLTPIERMCIKRRCIPVRFCAGEMHHAPTGVTLAVSHCCFSPELAAEVAKSCRVRRLKANPLGHCL
jgi:hypothetical protein